YIGDYLKETISGMKAGIRPDAIQLLLNPSEKDNLKEYDRFLSDIVDSQLDADRMDYLVRDAHLTGIPTGRISATVLQENIIPYKNEADAYTMNFAESVLPYIDHFLYARQTMYVNCYEESTKLSAEGMLLRAVDDFLTELN